MKARFLSHRIALAAALATFLGIAPWCIDGAGGAALAEVRNPSGVAVIVGNRDYEDRDVPEATFAHRDADAFRRYVVDVLGYDPENIIDLRDTKGRGRGRHPIINVSWEDAKTYAGWLSRQTGESYRLLSEAEWEYAARAGATGPFHFGLTISTDQASYDGKYTYGSGRKGVFRKKTVPVGSFPANAFGLHDMHGNVREWVEECWHGSYASAPPDGSAWTSGGDWGRRVLRGGSWINGPWSLRSADRDGNSAGNRGSNIGFRVARTLTP